MPDKDQIAKRMAALMDRQAKEFLTCTTNQSAEAQESVTTESILAQMRQVMDEIGPPPPRVLTSRYAMTLPTAEPRTDDMREMVERIGRSRVPAALRFTHLDGIETIVVHPDLIEGKLNV